MRRSGFGYLPIAAAVLLTTAGGSAPARGQGHAGHGTPPSAPAPPGSVRITMDELHAGGGVPPGWRFTLPAGDAEAGRRVFVDLKCYACHQIRGEAFSLKPGETATAGPDLTGMARHHPTEYLVESILNPNAVLVEGPGYIGGDGRSIMPPTPDMTVAQLIDLVAYLKSRGGDMGHVHDVAREQTVGGYRVRLVFRAAGGSGHEHAHHQHGGAMAMPAAGKGRLVAFVADPASGQAIPYLPVTARLEATGKPLQTVKLTPAFGAEGFHYGADIVLPDTTSKVTISVGPVSAKMQAGAPAQLSRSQTLAFEWK